MYILYDLNILWIRESECNIHMTHCAVWNSAIIQFITFHIPPCIQCINYYCSTLQKIKYMSRIRYGLQIFIVNCFWFPHRYWVATKQEIIKRNRFFICCKDYPLNTDTLVNWCWRPFGITFHRKTETNACSFFIKDCEQKLISRNETLPWKPNKNCHVLWGKWTGSCTLIQ